MPSTAIEFASYDPDMHVMLVKYQDDGLYQYFGVSQGEYDGYRASESKGKFMNENIKPSHAYAKTSH